MKLKEFLKGKLSEKEIKLVPSSYDIVGDIAIFNEVPGELVKKEKIIGNSILKLHKNIRVVCKKTRKYSGRYRTPKLKIIAGEKRKETTYIENGCRFMLDVEKVYFSSRLGTERARVSNLVKPKEQVLVMFSGCGPYTVQIAKKAKRVVGIEINPVAHRYALINLKLNKISNAVALEGDVAKIAPRLKEKFDRIVMPLPKTSFAYLKSAFALSKKGTIFHFYTFAKEDDFESIKKDLLSACKRFNKKCKILRIVKAGEYSPRTYRICIDFVVQ